MNKTISAIMWALIGASLSLIITSGIYNNPVMFAIGFIILTAMAFIYYMFGTSEKADKHTRWKNQMDNVDWDKEVDNWIEKRGLKAEPDIMTNSEITAACIRAGITDPEDIKWVQEYPLRTTEGVQEAIQYLLTKKEQLK